VHKEIKAHLRRESPDQGALADAAKHQAEMEPAHGPAGENLGGMRETGLSKKTRPTVSGSKQQKDRQKPDSLAQKRRPRREIQAARASRTRKPKAANTNRAGDLRMAVETFQQEEKRWPRRSIRTSDTWHVNRCVLLCTARESGVDSCTTGKQREPTRGSALLRCKKTERKSRAETENKNLSTNSPKPRTQLQIHH
jgi:hypothetical protein